MEEVLTPKGGKDRTRGVPRRRALMPATVYPMLQRVRRASMIELYSGFRMAQLGRKEAH